ncbi:hypothetical protein CJI51_07735 [Bifidobacteriaceae bacterium WP021]|nr:hypothetical protein CJI51_07735 [Bifidobacteriaceae bacterium WP021]
MVNLQCRMLLRCYVIPVIVAVFANFAIFATITRDLVIIVCTMVLLWYYVGCCRSVIIKQSMNNKFMILRLKETT